MAKVFRSTITTSPLAQIQRSVVARACACARARCAHRSRRRRRLRPRPCVRTPAVDGIVTPTPFAARPSHVLSCGPPVVAPRLAASPRAASSRGVNRRRRCTSRWLRRSWRRSWTGSTRRYLHTARHPPARRGREGPCAVRLSNVNLRPRCRCLPELASTDATLPLLPFAPPAPPRAAARSLIMPPLIIVIIVIADALDGGRQQRAWHPPARHSPSLRDDRRGDDGAIAATKELVPVMSDDGCDRSDKRVCAGR